MDAIDRVCPKRYSEADVPEQHIRIKIIMTVEDAKMMADDRDAAFVYGEMRAFVEGLGLTAMDAEEGDELVYCDVTVDRAIIPQRACEAGR